MKRLSLMTLLILSACTSAEKRFCQEANWIQEGTKDALSGKKNRASHYQTFCLNEEVNINPALYSQGYEAGYAEYCSERSMRQLGRTGGLVTLDCPEKFIKTANNAYHEGLNSYCTTASGMNVGRNGGEYLGVCPKDTESSFLSGYQAGKTDFLSSQVSSLRSEVGQLKSKLDDSERTARDLEWKLRDRDSQISNLESKIRDLESRHR